MLLPLLRHMVPINDRNCRLTLPIVKGRCAHDELPRTFDIGVFESVIKNSTTIKHIYAESTNIIESSDVVFDTNDWWNFP